MMEMRIVRVKRRIMGEWWGTRMMVRNMITMVEGWRGGLWGITVMGDEDHNSGE